MFIRFVHLRVKPEMLQEIRRLYDEGVIPALQHTEGCRYAGLLQNEHRPDECISMTMWDTKSHADRYGTSEVFASLLHDAEPFLAGSSEMRIKLSKDLMVEYEPVPEEPSVAAYNVEASNGEEGIPRDRSLYIRLVVPHVQDEKVNEFKKIYVEDILPSLRRAKGCRYAYLTESTREQDRFISVTIWESRKDAEEYERSGLFASLSTKVKHTFSGVYQMKMQIEKETGKQVVTSDDISVEGFTIVTGKNFF